MLHSWNWREPSLAETLSDPVIRAVMAADAVDPAALAALLREAALKVESTLGPSRPAESEIDANRGSALSDAARSASRARLRSVAGLRRARDPIFSESMEMDANLSNLQPLAQPMTGAKSTLSLWLQRMGLQRMGFARNAEAPGQEPAIDGATMVARKADGRQLRKEASRHAERPPIPF